MLLVLLVLLVILRALFMHSRDQCAGMLGVNIRCNAMSQIEDVARAVTKLCQYVGHLFPDNLRCRIKHCRVKVTLQSNPVANTLSRQRKIG